MGFIGLLILKSCSLLQYHHSSMVHWSFLLEGVGTLDIESLFSGLAYVASFLPEFLVAVDDLTFAKQSMYCMFVSVTVASQL